MRAPLMLLLLSAAGLADAVTDAADQVLEAWRAKNDLKDFAAKDDWDPWLVAVLESEV